MIACIFISYQDTQKIEEMPLRNKQNSCAHLYDCLVHHAANVEALFFTNSRKVGLFGEDLIHSKGFQGHLQVNTLSTESEFTAVLKRFLNVGSDANSRSLVSNVGRLSFCFGKTINISWLKVRKTMCSLTQM